LPRGYCLLGRDWLACEFPRETGFEGSGIAADRGEEGWEGSDWLQRRYEKQRKYRNLRWGMRYQVTMDDEDEDEEESGEVFMKMRCWLFLPSPTNSSSPLSVAESRRPDPTGREILVVYAAFLDATAYAVEPILRGAPGEETNLG
jgi:hypothetical protein